jgi:DNA-binding CsgD family transcriptional regulator
MVAHRQQDLTAFERENGLTAVEYTFPVLYALTGREETVARLLVYRLRNKEIAQYLGISERTVETHVTHVLAKLNVSRLRVERAAQPRVARQIDDVPSVNGSVRNAL